MALTITEAAKLSNDFLVQGVAEEIVKDDPLLQLLPFQELSGTALRYNRENAAASAAWFAVGDSWTEGVGTFTEVTTALKVVGGDADVDAFLARTYSNVQDLEATVIQGKAKAVRDELRNVLVTGDTGVDAKKFDGIDKLCVAGQTVSSGTNGATLTLDKLEQLIDQVKGGQPDVLLMSRRSRRKINSLSRAAGGFLQTDRDAFGRFIQFYNGIPIGVSDYISDAVTVGSSSDCSTIYAFRMGPGAVMGLTNGFLQVEEVGPLETKNARRWRVKMYAALALFSTVSLAKLTGVRD
jgi:HK97 family phage major capsid protein